MATSFFDLNRLAADADLEFIATTISSKIISYIMVLALSNFKMIKESINISLINWFSIIIIPIGTLISTILLISRSNDSNMLLIVISVFVLFLINIFAFYLYDSLMKNCHEKMERELLRQQNNAYSKQFELINQSQENLKMLRHDIKNHITSLQSLIEKNENERAINYLKDIYDYVNCSNEYARSGNSEVDSIINYKLSEAVKHGIKVNLNMNIPDKLNINPFDLSVILGNLIDNAIEATSKLNDAEEINVFIEYERNIVYISVSNPYDGLLSYENSKLKTTCKDTENHGLGLRSVQKSIDKYNGAVDIHHTGNMFYVDALIYNQSINGAGDCLQHVQTEQFTVL